MRPRYYTRTVRPHVWAVMERHADNLDPEKRPCSDLDLVLEWVGAKQHRGDANAREYARATCERLNRIAVQVIKQLSLTDQVVYAPNPVDADAEAHRLARERGLI